MPRVIRRYADFFQYCRKEQHSILSSITTSPDEDSVKLYKILFSSLEKNEKYIFVKLNNYSYFINISAMLDSRFFFYCLQSIEENKLPSILVDKNFYLIKLISDRFDSQIIKKYLEYLPKDKKIKALKSDNFYILTKFATHNSIDFLKNYFDLIGRVDVENFLSTRNFLVIKKVAALEYLEMLNILFSELSQYQKNSLLDSPYDIFFSLAELSNTKEFNFLFSCLTIESKINLISYNNYSILKIIFLAKNFNLFKEVFHALDNEQQKDFMLSQELVMFEYLSNRVPKKEISNILSIFDINIQIQALKYSDFKILKLICRNDLSDFFLFIQIFFDYPELLSEAILSEDYIIPKTLVAYHGNFDLQKIASHLPFEKAQEVFSFNEFYILRTMGATDVDLMFEIIQKYFVHNEQWNLIAKSNDFFLPKLFLFTENFSFFQKILEHLSTTTICEMILSEDSSIVSKLVECGYKNLALGLIRILDSGNYEKINSKLNFIFPISKKIDPIFEEIEDYEDTSSTTSEDASDQSSSLLLSELPTIGESSGEDSES